MDAAALGLVNKGVRMGIQAAKRRRNTRIKAGKWVLGARAMGIPFSADSTPRGRRRARRNKANTTVVTTVQQAPLRNNIQQTAGRRPEQRVADEEVIFSAKRASNTVVSDYKHLILSPTSEALLTRLPAIAANYQKYDTNKFILRWKPNSGQAVNGRIIFAVIPRTDIDMQQYNINTPDEAFNSIPGAYIGAISVPGARTVPPTQLIHQGRDMFVDDGGTSVGDQNMFYFSGTLLFKFEGMDSGSGPLDLGTLTLEYDFVLKDQIVNQNPTAAMITDLTVDPQLTTSRTSVELVADQPSQFVLVKRRPHVIVLKFAHGLNATLSKNGSALTELYECVSTDGNTHYRMYTVRYSGIFDLYEVSAACDVVIYEHNNLMDEFYTDIPALTTVSTTVNKKSR